MAKEDVCDVCGGTETRLVDGFYYCAECGTQDTNVRETVVEHTALGDGTFAFASKQKFSVKIKDGVKMSAEWHKWHSFNFILAGLTEELLGLGAAPDFKMKVLWIWAKYMRKFQKKNLMGFNGISELKDKSDSDKDASQEDAEKNKPRPAKMTRSVLVTILYLALNLDKSYIQLSHLRRYIQAGQIGVHRSEEYVPKEMETKAIRGWSGFKQSRHKFHCSLKGISSAMQQCKDLNLGPYLVPNLEILIDNLLKELCLPNELKQLVLSLMDFAPVDFLAKSKQSNKLPDFEGLVLSYILVALKMCFGLDDDYEIRLSQAVDKINEEENYLKAYKTDMFTEKTDRMFSFREWCNYLLFRKYMLCKHNLPIARERGLFLDDYVYMEQSENQTKKEVMLRDEVTMDIINKIPQKDNADVIPISEFEPSTTPLSTLTDVISRHLRNIDTRILLTEDFTQYSIDYVCKELALPLYSEESSENIVSGVSTSGKTFNDFLGLNLTSSYSDDTMVFVRNCENKNWFKTKRPTEDHIVKLEEVTNKDIDHGYDSLENTPDGSTLQLRYSDENQDETIPDVTNKEITPIITDTNTHDLNHDDEETKDRKLELFKEEEEGKNIFDDDFLDLNNEETNFFDNDINETKDTVQIENDDHEDSKVGLQSLSIDSDVEAEPEFDPATFNREETIKQLVIAACREYKVPIPARFRPTREPSKRKMNVPNREAGASAPKRAKPDEAKLKQIAEKRTEVKELLNTYYSNLEKDGLHEVSQQVRSFIGNVENENLRNDSVDEQQINEIENTSPIEFDTNIPNGMESRHDVTNPSEVDTRENNLDKSEIDECESDDGSVQDPVYKGDPQFDEKTHDVKQLYVKVKGQFEAKDHFDLDSDDEINKLLEEQIKHSEKTVAENVGSDHDSLDDMPLSKLKKRKKRKRNREHLIEKPENINGFNYWFKHYLSQTFKKHESLERFDAEVREKFPKSFAFVLFECAAVLNCSAHSLYRHVTDIEEKMLQKDGYERKNRHLKEHGIRLDRREPRL